MIRHLVRMTALVALILLCTTLPFLPGRYDALAAPLSLMAQVFGYVGLLLVPIGLLWLAAQRWWPRLNTYAFGMAALIVASLVWLLVSLGAALDSFALGVAFLALGVFLARKAGSRLRSLPAATPLYLVLIPVTVLAGQRALATPLTDFSRNRAIRNSAPLIAEIEQYRARNGHYPKSIVAQWPDIWPSVIGIREYRYEPQGDAYNLVFEQFTFVFGTREFVMYNPRDEQGISSHALDVLQLTPEQLALDRTRGHYAERVLPQRHWKYFRFD